ncbi:MAG: preprotein translocase subunit SecG [Congregibacter sp.]
MEQLVLVVHLLLSLAIIGLIMLQQGKGADVGASFGAGASQTLFGSGGGGNVLTRATAWMVALFFATSFGLAIIATNKTSRVDTFDLPIPMNQESGVLGGESSGSDDTPSLSAGDLPVVDDSLPEIGGSAEQGDIPKS